jgi:hypothetical protein
VPARRLVPIAAALTLAAILLALLVGGVTVHGSQLAARYTARTSFALFIVAYGLGPWLSRGAPAIGPRERSAWLAFVTAHVIHLGCVGVYVGLSGNAPVLERALGGILGYAAVAAIGIVLSPAGSVGQPKGRRVTTIGGLYLTFVFVMSYLPRVTQPGSLHVEAWAGYLALLALAVSLPLLRFALARRAALVS